MLECSTDCYATSYSGSTHRPEMPEEASTERERPAGVNFHHASLDGAQNAGLAT